MKIDVTQVLKSLDGSDVDVTELPKAVKKLEGVTEEHRHKYEASGDVFFLRPQYRVILTLRKVFTDSLIDIQPGDEKTSQAIKFDRGKLAFKIQAAEQMVDLTVDQLADLKPLISRSFGPLVIAQAFDMIEQAEPDAKPAAGEA